MCKQTCCGWRHPFIWNTPRRRQAIRADGVVTPVNACKFTVVPLTIWPCWPVPHYKIAPQKSLPGSTIYRQNLPVNCRPREDFSAGGGWFYNGEKLFMGPVAIFIRGKHIDLMIIFPRADFSWGDILMWHRPSQTVIQRCYIVWWSAAPPSS